MSDCSFNMEMRDAASDAATGTDARTASRPGSVTSGVETQTQKRVIKLTAKALAEKLDRLQNGRKAKLNKASTQRNVIQNLMSKGEKTKVQYALDDLMEMCEEAKCRHDSLLVLLPCDEKEKHEIWFKAKMLANDECIANTKMWVSSNESIAHENDDVVDENDDDDDVVDDDINPDDSVSNVGSKRSSQRSGNSGKSSTTSSARVKAEAERASLMARIAALKAKHALEEEEQQLRRKKGQLKLETELAASAARLAVLHASNLKCTSQATSNGMNSYVEKEQRKGDVSVLNPKAKEFKPETCKSTQQNDLTKVLLLHDNTMEVQSKETVHCLRNASIPQHIPNEQQQENNLQGMPQSLQDQLGAAHIKDEEVKSAYPKQISQNPSGDLFAIMQRQNEITAALVQQQRSLSLPPRDIPIFDGDPLQYRAFIKAFEQGVEEKAGQVDCLYYLEQFTRGQPRELVRSCQHMASERGYAVAKDLLREHFGNQYKTATAYMERALAWQSIKSEDVKTLQAYSLFLRGCCNVMEELEYMQELDMPVNMRAIITKLPYKMREQWRTKAHDIMGTTGHRASFSDLVTFIERRVSILSDPLFGDIQDQSTNAAVNKTLTRFKSQPRNKVRGSVVATTVTSLEPPEEVEEPPFHPEKAESVGCLCCSRNHSLEECKQFKGKKHKEKLLFLREKRICFACLCSGHMSRDCERRLTCQVCSQTHPTVLHINRQTTALEQERKPSKHSGSLTTCGHTGAGKDRCVLSILPVKVKTSKGNHIINTYAFLDPGSSGTFCSEHLMQKLNVTGKRTNFLLRTMGQTKVTPAYSLFDVEVSGLDSNDFYLLPEIITQQKMPVTTDDMITSEDLCKWPYLSKVHIPSIKANVDLLIGTNAPKLLEPWEVINSQGNGPYAVRTVLGWVVNGPLDGGSDVDQELHSATVNRVSVCKL